MLAFGYLLLANSVMATLFAVAVWWCCRRIRRPAVVHLLWVFVLLRLLMPPVLPLDLAPAGNWLATNSVEKSNEAQQQVVIALRVVPLLLESLQQPTLLPTCNPMLSSQGLALTKLAKTTNSVAVGKTLLAGVQHRFASFWRHHQTISNFLVPAWLLAVIGYFGFQIASILYCRRLLAALSYSTRVWQKRTEKVAARMGLKRCPEIRLVRAAISPMLWGYGPRTRILFPEQLLMSLSRRAQNTLIAHELGHYRRGDQWVRLVELIATACFWWHPVLWIARREIERVEEQCCDALAVRQANGSPRTYAEALLATVDFISVASMPPVASGASRKTQVADVRQRLEAIMKDRFLGNTLTPDSHPSMLALAALMLIPFPVFLSTLTTPAAGTNGPSSAAVATQNGVGSTADPTSSSFQSNVASNYHFDGKTIAVSAQGDQVVTLGDNQCATLHRLPSQRRINLGVGRVASLCFSNDGSSSAIGTLNGTVEIIDCLTGRVKQVLDLGNAAISTVSFSPDDQMLAVGTRDGICKLIDLNGKKQEEVVRRRRNERVDCVRFSEDGRWAAVVWNRRAKQTIEIWNLVSGRIVSSLAKQTSVVAVQQAPSTDIPSWFLIRSDGSILQWTTEQPLAYELEETIPAARRYRYHFAPVTQEELFRDMNECGLSNR